MAIRHFTVYDALGNMVWASNYTQPVKAITLDIKDWKTGNYFVLIENSADPVVLKFQKN
ncbi:MAG: T9SS type A sorting domain-containing protein [Crocinitomicaceae bacterium]|nr:T9SS type A sorting domain-containing protein [Crocinitomicaceae bacterium]